MNKKIISIVVIIVIIILGAGFYYWWSNTRDMGPDDLSDDTGEGIQYYNDEYTYSLTTPEDWFVGYLGDKKETANVIWWVTNEADIELADGGPPLGAKVELIITDLKEMRDMDPRSPEISSAQDWVDWRRTGYSKLVEDLDDYNDEIIKVAGKTAIKTIEEGSQFENAGPIIEVVLFDKDNELIYSLKYLGQEPAYSKNLAEFDSILSSFSL